MQIDVFHWFGCDRRRTRLIPFLGPITEQRLLGPVPIPRPHHHPFHHEDIMATLTLTDSQQCPLSVQAADKRGNPTGTLPAGTVVTYLVDNPNVLTLTDNHDGTALIASAGPIGAANVTVNAADASGNAIGTGTLAVTVIAGAPTTITVVPGTPVEQP